MSQDPIAAIGTRIERQLTALDARHKAAEAIKTQRAMKTAVPFTLLNDAPPLPDETAVTAGAAQVANPTPAANADFGVGATFRRKGQLSDVPMTITRAGDGVVVAAFSDTAGSYEVAFDANQIELVSKAPVLQASPVEQYFPGLLDLVKKATPLAAAAMAADATPVTATAPAATATAVVDPAATPAAATDGSAVSATAAPAIAAATATAVPVSAAPTAPELSLPAGAIRLPDGTLQFPYAPTDSIPGRVPVVQPPVPPEFGVGATFRRKGVIGDIPMTVTRVGDGVLMANITFEDRDGRHEMAFIPDQLELVTRAPPTA